MSPPLEYNNPAPTNSIFGVPLEESIQCAHATIQIRDKYNQTAVGKIPVIVANCARLLKKDATQVEGIFRLSGSARRIKELQAILTDPAQNYGKDLDWAPYNVHDAANLLRRYLNNLPEPIIPLSLYNKFREPLDKYPEIVEQLQGLNAISAITPPVSSAISPAINTEDSDPLVKEVELPPPKESVDPLEKVEQLVETTAESKSTPVDKTQLKRETKKAIRDYCELIDHLPILNQQLLLYILDLLYTFSQESEKNLMPAVNLASIFQPSILSHPAHDMSPKEYHLSRAVTQFLIEQFPKLAGCAVRTWVPPQAVEKDTPQTNEDGSPLQALTPRRHSKSMSSVNLPSTIKDLNLNDVVINGAQPLKTTKDSMPPVVEKPRDEIPPQFKPTMFRRRSRQNSDSLSHSNPNSGRNSPLVSPSDEKRASGGGFFQALKRGASLSRRRTSSSSTGSSVLGLEHLNTSSSSLNGSRQGRNGSRSGSIPSISMPVKDAAIVEGEKEQMGSKLKTVENGTQQEAQPNNVESEEATSEKAEPSVSEEPALDEIRKEVDEMEEIKEETPEALEAVTTIDEGSELHTSPTKSPSSVTITPNREILLTLTHPEKSSSTSDIQEGKSIPVIEPKNTNGSSEKVISNYRVTSMLLPSASSHDSSDIDTSETETSQSEFSDIASNGAKDVATKISGTMNHQRNISSLLSRRSGSPTLSLGQNPAFRRIDNHRMFSSTSELNAPSIASALASPSVLSTSAQSVNGSVLSSSILSPGALSPAERHRSLAFFGAHHNNDSESSVGVESDEDFGSTFSGRTELSQIDVSGRPNTGRSRRNVSRWRRSLMALNIPFSSPDATEEDRNPLDVDGHSGSNSRISPITSGGAATRESSPGGSWLKRLSRNKRSEGSSTPTGASIAAETSDSGFSS